MFTVSVTTLPTPTAPVPAVIPAPEVASEATVGAVVSLGGVVPDTVPTVIGSGIELALVPFVLVVLAEKL
jgi:hypothetical protein